MPRGIGLIPVNGQGKKRPNLVWKIAKGGARAGLFCNDEKRSLEFTMLMNAGRIVVNMPSVLGAFGRMCNRVHPSFPLGRGTGGKNITTDNFTARHLINLQRITRRPEDHGFQRFAEVLYWTSACTPMR